MTELLGQISLDIRSYQCDDTFNATFALLVTWDGMLPETYGYYCVLPKDRSYVRNHLQGNNNVTQRVNTRN